MKRGQKRSGTKDLALCAVFTVLLIAGAFIRIPGPLVPITLQMEFVLLCGLLLGGVRCAICCGVYLFMGLCGLPVFTGGGGIGYVMQPTFGFLVGFLIGGAVTGFLAQGGTKSPGWGRLFAATGVGFAIVYTVGYAYLYCLSNFVLGTSVAVDALFLTSVLPTLPADLILCVFVVIIGKRLLPFTVKTKRTQRVQVTEDGQ